MAVVLQPAFQQLCRFTYTEESKSSIMLNNHYLLKSLSSEYFKGIKELLVWFDTRPYSPSEAGEKNRRIACILSCLFLQSNRTMNFHNEFKVVHEALHGEDKCSSECNYEVSDFLAGVFNDESNALQMTVVQIFAMLLHFVQRICLRALMTSSLTVTIFGFDRHKYPEMTDEEVEGSGDDRQKRKQTDSKHEGDKGKNSKGERGTSSGACGAGEGGSSGDDGGDGGEDRGRKDLKGGPQSSVDEAMEEDEEKEDVEDLEKGKSLDITNVGICKKIVFPKAEERDPAEEMRMQRRREAAEAAVAEQEAAAAAAAAVVAAAAAAEAAAATAVSRNAEDENSGDEATAGPSRSIARSDEEDPEEVGRMSGSPETPSEGTPSQTPTPPPDVTDASVASDA